MKKLQELIMKYKNALIVIGLAVTGLAVYYFRFAGNSDLESMVYVQKAGVIEKLIEKAGSILEKDKYAKASYEIVKVTSKPGKVKDVYDVTMIYDTKKGGRVNRYRELIEEWSFREKKAKFIREVSDGETIYEL